MSTLLFHRLRLILPVLSLIVTSWTTPVETVRPGATLRTVALMLIRTPLSNEVTVAIETSIIFGGCVYSNVNRRGEAVKVVAALMCISKSSVVRLFLIAHLHGRLHGSLRLNEFSQFVLGVAVESDQSEGLCAIIDLAIVVLIPRL